MKKLGLLIVSFLLASMSVNAQKKRLSKEKKAEIHQKILEKKLVYMKENLMLNEKESQAFEKVYRDYINKKQQLQEAFRKKVISKVKGDALTKMSDKEMNAVLDTKVEIDKEKNEINQKLTDNLRQILPPRKVIQYFKLERKFNKKLAQRFKNRRMKKRRLK